MKILLAVALCAPCAAAPGASGGTVDTEARGVIGFQQAGASGSKLAQSFFFDFFIDRGLASPRWSLWGNVRIASAPQETTSPVAALDAAGRLAQLHLDQMAQHAGFSTGLDYHPWTWNAGGAMRRLGLIASVGATAPLDRTSTVELFVMPDRGSPQYAAFASVFPGARESAYIGFLASGRRRFFRSWEAGIRLATFGAGAPAATYSLTAGQDEAITGGRMQGFVGKIDVFYPLPVALRGTRYLYMFGSAGTRLGRAAGAPALILEAAPATVKGFEPNVAIVSVPSNRDLYRIGIGIDAVALVCFLAPASACR
jgi:hypothetical protein